MEKVKTNTDRRGAGAQMNKTERRVDPYLGWCLTVCHCWAPSGYLIVEHCWLISYSPLSPTPCAPPTVHPLTYLSPSHTPLNPLVVPQGKGRKLNMKHIYGNCFVTCLSHKAHKTSWSLWESVSRLDPPELSRQLLKNFTRAAGWLTIAHF